MQARRKIYYKNSFGMKEMISPICHVVNGCKSNEANFKKFATVTKQSFYCKFKKDFKWSCHDFHRRSYFGSFKKEKINDTTLKLALHRMNAFKITHPCNYDCYLLWIKIIDYKLSIRVVRYLYRVLTNWQVRNLEDKTLNLQTPHNGIGQN